MIGTMFNGDAGFKFAEIEADSRHYRVDVLQCPYMKYCELLGCKELTGTFCLSDDRVYGNIIRPKASSCEIYLTICR